MSKITLKCDKSGFLVGDIIDKKDCSQVRQSVAMPTQGMQSVQSVAMPTQKKKSSDDPLKRKPLQKTVTPKNTLLRDDKGRYLPKSQQPSQTESPDAQNKESSQNNRLIDAIKTGLSKAGSNLSADAQGIDPTIDAMKEASTPLVMAGGAIKTASSLFSRKDDKPIAVPQITRLTKIQTAQNTSQNRDWRGFFKRFDLFAKNQSVFNKAADKTLKDIEKKPITQGGSSSGGLSIGGGIKGMFKKLPIVGGLLGALFAANSLSDTEEDNTLSRRDKDKANGKTIGGVGGMLSGAVAGAALGSFIPIVGTIIGGIAGAFFGGSAGELLGETVGGWVNDLRSSDITGTIATAWDDVSAKTLGAFESLSSSASKSWDDMTVKFSPVIDGMSSLFSSISEGFSGALSSLNGWIKNLTDINVGAEIKSGYEAVKNYAKESPAGKGFDYAKDQAVSGYEKAMDFVTGDSKARKQALESEMTKGGITNNNERAMIMAQADHESAGFLHNEERFEYKTPEQLMKVSATARNKGKDEVQAALNGGDESTAELMYGGRMGNTAKGDGYKYRGRGSFQLTGKDNYKQAGTDLGLDLVNNPDLAMDKDNSAKIAVWYAKKNKIQQAAQAGDVESVTKTINGGQNGIDDRKKKFAMYGGVVGKSATQEVSKEVESEPSLTQDEAPIPQSVADNDLSERKARIEAIGKEFGRNASVETIKTPEQDALSRQIANVQNAAIATPNIASPTIPSAPSFSESDIPPMPNISESLNSPSAIKVKIDQQAAFSSQDVPDRALAHIITGGIGG